jgi:hypothetical protein
MQQPATSAGATKTAQNFKFVANKNIQKMKEKRIEK